VAMHRYRVRLLSFLVLTPLAVPDILTGVSLLLLFVLVHLTLGMASVVLAHVSFCISFVAIVVRSSLAGMDPQLAEAARDLGATPWQAFRRIVLPLIAPGILAGALLAFTLSIDDFVITFFTAGAGTSTLPLEIYSMLKVAVTPEVNAVSTLLLLVSLTLFAAASRLAPSMLRQR
jgi:spermidine/putrescine transport system permease protein